MRDATEYQFVAGDRRLMVRSAEQDTETVDLLTAARDYARRWEQYLGAIDVVVSEVLATPQGGEAVRVSATLPDGLLRAALLKFVEGPLVELALMTSPFDVTVDVEFERVMASARPFKTEPIKAVASALAAGPRGTVGYPAGPLILDLPDSYSSPTLFTLKSADNSERYTLERSVDEAQGRARAGVPPPILATSLDSAIGEDGLPVRFEVAPPFPTARGVGAPWAGVPSLPVNEIGGASFVTDSSGPSVRGTVRGAGVRVRFDGPAASVESVRQLLDTLNATN